MRTSCSQAYERLIKFQCYFIGFYDLMFTTAKLEMQN